MYIGITGNIGAGKDYLAHAIRFFGWRRAALADSLKQGAARILQIPDWWMHDRELKEAPSALPGITHRRFLQIMGDSMRRGFAEAIREGLIEREPSTFVDPEDLWLEVMKLRLERGWIEGDFVPNESVVSLHYEESIDRKALGLRKAGVPVIVKDRRIFLPGVGFLDRDNPEFARLGFKALLRSRQSIWTDRDKVVLSDVRYDNEAYFVVNNRGLLFHKTGGRSGDAHASEAGISDFLLSDAVPVPRLKDPEATWAFLCEHLITKGSPLFPTDPVTFRENHPLDLFKLWMENAP